MPTATLATDDFVDAQTVPALRVLIAYDDEAAYRRAVRMLANTFGGEDDADQVRPLPWRFDQVSTEISRRHANADASEAEIFVISTSDEERLPTGTAAWLDECFALRRNRSTAVVALPSVEASGRESGDGFRQRVRRAAEDAGLDFILAAEPAVAAV